jgi:hypothetical protein
LNKDKKTKNKTDRSKRAYKVINEEQFPIESGICPDSEFLSSLSSFKAKAPPISVGMLPFSLLSLKSRISNSFKSPKVPGTGPKREFFDRFKNCKLLKTPMEDAILPEKSLCDKSRN